MTSRSSSSSDFVDLYALLGVPHTAPADEIRRAFRKLALKHHPDKQRSGRSTPGGGGAAASTDAFIRLREAADRLTDAAQRARYDDEWRAWRRQQVRREWDRERFDEWRRRPDEADDGGAATAASTETRRRRKRDVEELERREREAEAAARTARDGMAAAAEKKRRVEEIQEDGRRRLEEMAREMEERMRKVERERGRERGDRVFGEAGVRVDESFEARRAFPSSGAAGRGDEGVGMWSGAGLSEREKEVLAKFRWTGGRRGGQRQQ
ncbi:Chaperone protein dnaJ 3 [Phlyctochytrium bullatum]|nr:Chaperone protein dnaJ 3 [Phlyctochytrium bullatum]